MLTRDRLVRTGAVQRQLPSGGRKQRQPYADEDVLDVLGHLAGQQLSRVPGAAGQSTLNLSPLGLAERGDTDADAVRAGPAALHLGGDRAGVDVERDHLTLARIGPAALEPVADADVLQHLDEP